MGRKHNPRIGVCEVCKTSYQQTGYAQRYCSVTCKPKQPKQEYDSVRYKKRRKKLKEEGKIVPRGPTEKMCPACLQQFITMKSDVRFCSVSCRKKFDLPAKKEKARFKAILKKYGLTKEQYEEIERSQNGVCAICKRERKLCVDHDHVTLKVRGLLCKICNQVLGSMNDSPEYLRTAADYLERKRK